jgi:hypothetical protein
VNRSQKNNKKSIYELQDGESFFSFLYFVFFFGDGGGGRVSFHFALSITMIRR